VAKKTKEEWKTYGNVFDQFTLRILHYFANRGYFEEVSHSLALGKEANVFLAPKDDGFVAVKIYRLENCNFNKMLEYIKSDPRFPSLKPAKRDIIFAWVLREHRNLLVARQAGVRVPTPYIYKGNVLVEEYIGDGLAAAPQLKNAMFENDEEIRACFEEVVVQVRKMWHDAKLVHADLSEFNILYYDKKPVLIDFSQTTSSADYHAKEYLARDMKNVVNFFTKCGVECDLEDVLEKILKK
jgi:RIO kinase 1